MRKILALLLAILSPALLTAQINSANQSFVLIHVTVIDMTGSPPKPEMTVVINGNRIAAIGNGGMIRVPKDARIIDGSGKFLIPGLWDMHAHSRGEDLTRDVFLPLFIVNGVTGIRHMFGDCREPCVPGSIKLESINHLRQQAATGEIVAPRIVASSPLVDGRVFWKGSIVVTNPEEARAAVRAIRQRGNDFLKVYSSLSRESYFALADEAKKQRLVFAGHIPVALSAIEVSDAGQKSIEHLMILLWAGSTVENEWRRERLQFLGKPPSDEERASRRADIKRLADTYDQRKAALTFARLAKNGTWVCPTLVVERSSAFYEDKDFINDARLKYLPSSVTDDWKGGFKFLFGERTAQDVADGKRLFKIKLAAVGQMHRAGVRLLAGTDEPNPYCFPGFSLHDELALFVEAGLSPFEALQTATTNPTKYLNLSDSLGTIEKGKIADLVLLDANPLEDIRNTRKIAAVIINGRYLPKESLQRTLACPWNCICTRKGGTPSGSGERSFPLRHGLGSSKRGSRQSE